MTTMTASFSSRCLDCGRRIAAGAPIAKGVGGKYVHAACAAGAPAPARGSAPKAPRASSARKSQPPAGPEMRNDRDAYAVGQVLVVQLTAAEVADCEARQAGVTATDVAGDKPVARSGDRRVAVVVIHTSRISAEWAEDNGHCGRYGAIVRLATAAEAAPVLAERAAKAAAKADAAAKEQAWAPELSALIAGRVYVETVELSERAGAVVLREERRGYQGTVSARWSRLVDGSIMAETHGYDDHRCGRYVTTEQLLDLARSSTRTLEDAVRGQRYSAIDRAIVWLAARAGQSPRPQVTVTLCGLEAPVTLVVRLVGPSKMVCAGLARGGSIRTPDGHTLYDWAWPIDRLRADLATAEPSPDVFAGIEFAPGAGPIAGDRLPQPGGLWIEGMRAALDRLTGGAS